MKLVLMALGLLVHAGVGISMSTSQGTVCPEGMVWGGLKCEWRNICPDGRPSSDGVCDEAEIRCPSGKVFVNGVCEEPETSKSCPKGYDLIEGICRPLANGIDVIESMRECQKAVVFTPKSAGLRVLLVNGEAGSLLEEYFSEAKRRKLAIEFESLAVIVFKPQGGQVTYRGGKEVKMTIGRYFKGATWQQIWVKALTGVRAGERSHPMMDAKRLEADVICGIK
jgi:hypothetical protein